MTIRVESSQSGERVDRVLAQVCPDLSRSAIRKLIDADEILVEGRSVRSSYRVSEGEQITLTIPEPDSLDLEAEDVPLDVCFEDEWLLVVNKPIGMVVHPSGALRSGTLVNALLGRDQKLSAVNGELRPGIVHRLDKDTSGLLVVAKDDVTHRKLATQLEVREIHRQYEAICWGHPEEEGTIETRINRSRRDRSRMVVSREGRVAVTHYRTRVRYDFLSVLDVVLQTGRTHQIRVHLDHIGHAVFGDPVYNGDAKRLKGISPLYRSEAARMLKPIDRQMLHARKLVFVHPHSGVEVCIERDPPEDMQVVQDELEQSVE